MPPSLLGLQDFVALGHVRHVTAIKRTSVPQRAARSSHGSRQFDLTLDDGDVHTDCVQRHGIASRI